MGWLAAMAVSGMLAGTNRPAAAADALVMLSCQQLSSEEAGKLETRIRVRLLASTSLAPRVAISCAEEQGTVVVESERARATREVALAGVDATEALVAAVESALEELSGRQDESTPVAADPTAGAQQPPHPVEAPAPRPRAALPPSSPVRSPARRPAAFAPGPERFAELSLVALAEAWRSRFALGAMVGAAYGSPTLAVGLRVGGLTAVPRYDAFSATELNAEATIAWQPSWSFGVRVSASMGPSLLVVAPQPSFKPRAGTTVAAWFGGITLARPFRFGHWAVVPEVGARCFSAERNVNLDDSERLALGPIVPRLGIGLTY